MTDSSSTQHDIDFSPSVNGNDDIAEKLDDIAEKLETLHQRRKHRAEIHRTGGRGMSDDEMERLEAKDEERRGVEVDHVRLEHQHAKAMSKQGRKRAREDALVEQGRHEADEVQEKARSRRAGLLYIVFFLLLWIWATDTRLTIGWLAVLSFLLKVT